MRGRSVLEIGCGPGGNLVHLAERRPSRLVGVDIAQPMLDLAADNVRGLPIEVELRHIDGRSLPFADGEFDTSMTVTVLHHNLDAEVFGSLLGEICRVTSGTVVLIEDTNPTVATGEATILRTVDMYRDACAAHGFELVEREHLGTRVSYLVHRGIVKLWRMAFGLQQEEGAPPPRGLGRLLSVGIWAARPLDDLVPDPGGLTRMSFQRTR